MVVGGKVLFCREDVEQHAVQQVASGARIIFDEDILQFDNLHLYLVCLLYTSYYEFNFNEKSDFVKGYEKDRKDNVLTVRLQYKF